MNIRSCLLLAVAAVAAAQNNTTQANEYPHDPYLDYRPPFARSLPVQILLTGVVLTLVAVLFIHLLFTGQYHWPLAPVNYVLQISGVTTLLISLIATLHVVLSAARAESDKWPYMLSYIAVNVPPIDISDNTYYWSVAERATWLVMNASTSGLIQITHIQFLTLLYPSRLEGRLIFLLLGPLAIVAATMQLLPIQGNTQVNNVASAVRNVCNATLSLLFTVALFIWGLLVNRKQAWRTDGGTAVFGSGALTLALVSTALNFLYVNREEEYVWLPSLMWAVVLWQSFLGWWWWVGAGSGAGLARAGRDDMEEKLRKEEKREKRRREARERRIETKKRAKRVWKGVASAFSASAPSTHSHPRPSSPSHPRPSSPSSPRHPSAPASIAPTTLTATSLYSFATLPLALPAVIHRWYASLRRAHVLAARQQAAERVQRIREMDRAAKRAPQGWGLGSFGWRVGRERDAEGDEGADEVELEERKLGRRGAEEIDEDEEGGEYEPYDRSGWDMRRRGEREQEESMPPQEDVVGSEKSDVDPPPAPPLPVPHEEHPAPATTVRLRSLWWWGPLGRWRLQDSTVYS